MFENLFTVDGLSLTDSLYLFFCIFMCLFLFFVAPVLNEKRKIKAKEEENKKIFEDLTKKSINFIFLFNSIDKVLLFNNKVISNNEWKLIILNRFNDYENIIHNPQENTFYTIKEIVETSEYIFIDKSLLKKNIVQG